MSNHDRRSGPGSSRAEQFSPLYHLSDEELLDRCQDQGIKVTIPYSQLESDAVLHGVSVDALLRDYLIRKLREVGEA